MSLIIVVIGIIDRIGRGRRRATRGCSILLTSQTTPITPPRDEENVLE